MQIVRQVRSLPRCLRCEESSRYGGGVLIRLDEAHTRYLSQGLRQRAERGADYRGAAGHSLEHSEGKINGASPFVTCGEQVQVDGGVQRCEIGDVFAPDNDACCG